MKNIYFNFIFLFIASTSLLIAQVSQIVKDFENPAKEDDGFYISGISGSDIVTQLNQITDDMYGGVLEIQINVVSNGNINLQVDNFDQLWTDSEEGAQFLTVDVFVPDDFPDSSYVNLWEMDQVWKATHYSLSNLNGGRTMTKGTWNTFIFEIKREYQSDPENYNPWNVNMGLEIQIFNSWTGSVLIDNVTLWSDATMIDDFENDISGWTNSGDLFISPPVWTNHAQYGGVIEMAVSNSTGENTTGDINLSDISLGWTDTTVSAVIMAMDLYIPEDFPDSSYFKFYNMDQTNWNLKRTLYSTSILNFGDKTTRLKKGVWNTIAFEVQQQFAVDSVNYFPWALIQAGLEINIDTVYLGTLYVDNLRLYSKDTLLPMSPSKLALENSVIFDFEDPVDGESGVIIDWGDDVATLTRIDHPEYGGILESVVSVDSTGGFSIRINGFDNHWTETMEGPAFLTIDVYVPVSFPDSSYIQVWQMDETKLQLKSNIYSPSYLNGGRPMIKGAWNTFTFDIRRFAQISGDMYNPANPASMGVEVQVKNDFTGSIYFDNITLLGACRTNAGKEFDNPNDLYGLSGSESVVSDIKLVRTASGGVLSFNLKADSALNANVEFNDFNNLWTQLKGGPALLVMDVFVPVDFPDSSLFQLWEMDKTHWNWQALLYAPTAFNVTGWHNTNLIKKGAWNTVMFDIRQSYQSNPTTYNPWLYVNMGFQFAMNEAWSGTIYVDNFCFIDAVAGLPTDVAMAGNIPLKFSLSQNYPNPFNPVTIINYQLPQPGRITLSVYNILGQKVATLVSGKQQAGTYSVEWDAIGFSSGLYYYSLETDNGFSQTKKLILLK